MYKICAQSSGVVAQLVEVSCFTSQRGGKSECKKKQSSGVVAQLVEHLLCKQGVVSSSLISSTRINRPFGRFFFVKHLQRHLPRNHITINYQHRIPLHQIHRPDKIFLKPYPTYHFAGWYIHKYLSLWPQVDIRALMFQHYSTPLFHII